MNTRPLTYIEVDLDAIAHNVRAIKRHIGPSVLLMAVVKANAYGHGVVEVARAALASGADWLTVYRVNDGVELRLAGINAPILVMGYTLPHEIDAAVVHDLRLTVTEIETAELLSARALRHGREMPFHIKVDTGMGRFGLLPDELLAFVQRVMSLPGLTLEGLFSHFSVADSADKRYSFQQLDLFQDAADRLETAGYHISVRHIANSAGMLYLPDSHLDAVRPGIVLYGLPPTPDIEPTIPLKPALSFKSHVVRVRTLPAGASISYGRTFVTPRVMPVALVPVGYGDGYHRLLSNRAAVLINGQRAPIVGRVCMDQCVVDISQVGPVALHDEVVLIGSQGAECITATEVASWAETLNYEVVTSLLPRVPRFYTKTPNA